MSVARGPADGPPGTVIDRRAEAPRNPAWRSTVEQAFTHAAFIVDNGIRMDDCGPGWCESSVALSPRHLQHTGVPHAGLIATLADHTAGSAAISVASPGETVLTLEFKLSLLRGIAAHRLHCRADVIKPGSSVSFAESTVEAELPNGHRKLVARASVTLIVVKHEPGSPKESP